MKNIGLAKMAESDVVLLETGDTLCIVPCKNKTLKLYDNVVEEISVDDNGKVTRQIISISERFENQSVDNSRHSESLKQH